MCCVLASSLVKETTNSQIKFSDRAGVSAAELMIETATGLWQKRNAELSELRERQKRCRVLETEANWKKLRRSPASYKKVKIDCLATNVGSKSEEEIQR